MMQHLQIAPQKQRGDRIVGHLDGRGETDDGARGGGEDCAGGTEGGERCGLTEGGGGVAGCEGAEEGEGSGEVFCPT